LQTDEAVSPRQFVRLRDGQRGVDLGDDFARVRGQVERRLRNNAPRTAVFGFVLVLPEAPPLPPLSVDKTGLPEHSPSLLR
jgi:hypothetical protein